MGQSIAHVILCRLSVISKIININKIEWSIILLEFVATCTFIGPCLYLDVNPLESVS